MSQKRNSVRAFWSCGPSPGNLGDVLNPHVIQWISGRTPSCHSVKTAKYFAIGSVARYATKRAHVWGSGAIDSKDILNPNTTYHAVRGPFTRNLILKQGGKCPEVYGDPALLLPLFYKKKIPVSYPVGIVPHYVDVKAVRRRYGELEGVRIIDPLRSNPFDVVDEIRGCEKILSSSLHGGIVAQSYGIPAIFVDTFEGKLAGDGIKFRDHFATCRTRQQELVQLSGNEKLSDLQKLVGIEDAEISVDLMSLICSCPFKNQSLAMGSCEDFPMVVSYFTEDYEKYASRLIHSVRHLGIEQEIWFWESGGNWLDNVRFKGVFIYNCLLYYKSPILFMDADTTLLRRPAIFRGDTDFDFCALPKPLSSPRPWSVSVMYFKPTEAVLNLTKLWAERCFSMTGVSEEVTLRIAWDAMGHRVNHKNLPTRYYGLKEEPGLVVRNQSSGNVKKYAKLVEENERKYYEKKD